MSRLFGAARCARFSLYMRFLTNLSETRNVGFATQSEQRRTVRIGDVSVLLPAARISNKVPTKYLTESDETRRSSVSVLRWLLQKDGLGQDVFLLAPPGSERRRLLFAYLELTGREVEYVALNADTTDSDLKQYRELNSSQALWRDQAAVRAATKGRVLVLDGVERAERNLLPLLNNLLENREMHLDDGGFLLRGDKYDKFAEKVGEAKLKSMGMRRVHDGFRVFALGLPVPAFKGNPLDPPLRSRFQCKSLKFPDFDDVFSELKTLAQHDKHIVNILNVVFKINSPEVQDLGLPFFSLDACRRMVSLMDLQFAPGEALNFVYPSFHLNENAQEILSKIVAKEFPRSSEKTLFKGWHGRVSVFKQPSQVSTDSGYGLCRSLVQIPSFVQASDNLSAALSVGDVCIIGPRGSGRNTLADFTAFRLGYSSESVQHVALYKDISGRELLQGRQLKEGTTVWNDSSIVRAALEGHCLVLDGIDVIDSTVLSSLQSLFYERELWLPDGTALLRSDRWQALGDAAKKSGARPVHPRFKIIAIAEPLKGDPTDGDSWLTPETSSMFMCLYKPILPAAEEAHLLMETTRQKPPDVLTSAVAALRQSGDAALRSLADCLSTRQLLRICRKLAAYPHSSVYDLLSEATLVKFAPKLTRVAFEETMKSCGLEAGTSHVTSFHSQVVDLKVTEDTVTIGDVVLPRNTDQEALVKVPSTLYFKNARQLEQLYRIAQDFALGEHLLLVGNQGVGKNKIIDYLLSVCNQPREYMQLHRDTTVASLSVQPQLIDGTIVYQDSPLVKAIREGRVVVIDEADKAPVQVVRVLHSLLARSHFLLADGRRVVPKPSQYCSDSEISLHPKFQAILLANRPGFPFMGHDFFPLVGDALAVHSVDAPDVASERTLLKSYAPDLSSERVALLVDLFSGLRSLYDAGQISYPFSTRELVNVVRHLAAFPDDGLLQALSNVLDFDAFDSNARKLIGDLVRSYGIPYGADPANVFLGETRYLGSWADFARFHVSWNRNTEIEKRPVKQIDKNFIDQTYKLTAKDSFPRIEQFTALSRRWMIPFSRLKDLAIVGGVPNLICIEGRPLIATLDEHARQWIIKVLPLEAVDLHLMTCSNVHGLGELVILDKANRCLYVCDINENALTLTDIPAGDVLYRDSVTLILKAKPTMLTVYSLRHSSNSFWLLTVPEAIEQAIPLGMYILVNRKWLYDLNNAMCSEPICGFPSGLRFLEESLFVSDLHVIGVVKIEGQQGVLRSVARSDFESGDEAVSLYGGEVVASIRHGPPLSLEYVDLKAEKVTRVSLQAPLTLLRACDVNAGRMFALERRQRDWHLNVYSLGSTALTKELRKWRQELGSIPRYDPQSPKHGKEDNLEHHGGNTWAGGTGGSDTAGLGGAGGPYRLDKGFDVHQVSDEIKRTVPLHIVEEARRMAAAALKQRLKEIDMSDSEHTVYRSYLKSVEGSVQALRVVLASLEGRRHEREWVRHRAEGDVDETKLVEAAAGEKNIFKRRMTPPHITKGRQEKPKRLLLLADVSGSMYRFNGHDRRLEREMEAVLLIMDALHGFQHKIEYEIRGHSGEESNIMFVRCGKPPEDEKARFRVLQKMHAHAQFCLSGDSTLQAIEEAVQGLKSCDDYDENCVILLSDANLERYGIPGSALAKAMNARQPTVQAYAIFIGSLGHQALTLKKELPSGHGFVCMDTKELPQIIKQIFTAKLI